jgi:uncharacterized OsmC-like protein
MEPNVAKTTQRRTMMGEQLEVTVNLTNQKAIQLSEETYCPVWAMVKNNVEIETDYKIIAS